MYSRAAFLYFFSEVQVESGPFVVIRTLRLRYPRFGELASEAGGDFFGKFLHGQPYRLMARPCWADVRHCLTRTWVGQFKKSESTLQWAPVGVSLGMMKEEISWGGREPFT
jgi:hypothetical protein